MPNTLNPPIMLDQATIEAMEARLRSEAAESTSAESTTTKDGAAVYRTHPKKPKGPSTGEWRR